MTTPASILLIGATGCDGLAIMNKLMSHPTSPQIHVFLPESSKLSQVHRQSCASVYEGNGRRATDVLEALQITGAEIIILSSDACDTIDQYDRTSRAWAVVSAMKMPGMEHVRAVLLSRADTGNSRINFGMGYGRLNKLLLRHKPKDTSQELAFLKCGLINRTVIIRATDLTDNQASGMIVEFGDEERPPSSSIARDDVALYIAKEVCESNLHGKIVNITGK